MWYFSGVRMYTDMAFKNVSSGQSWSGQPLGTCPCGGDTLSRAVLFFSAVPGGLRPRTRDSQQGPPPGRLPGEPGARLPKSLEACLFGDLARKPRSSHAPELGGLQV